MIRQATAQDELVIRDCAQQAYARYVPLIGKTPEPMVADFQAQIAAGYIYVAAEDGGEFQGFIVFYPQESTSFWKTSRFCRARQGGVSENP